MSAIEKLRRIVSAQKAYGELIKQGHSEEDRIEAVDECDAAIENTDFAALLAEVDGLVSVEGLAKQLLSLSPEDRAAVMHQFCRCCHKPISALDWSGGNFCDSCSPEPED